MSVAGPGGVLTVNAGWKDYAGAGWDWVNCACASKWAAGAESRAREPVTWTVGARYSTGRR